LISCEETMEVEVEGGIRFNGMFGMIRRVGDEVRLMRVIGGTLLALGDVTLTAERAAWRGRVAKTDASDPANNLVVLDPPLPAGPNLAGRTIHFINNLPMDTSYRIAAVTHNGVSTGDITIVRGLRDGADLASGYTYLVNPGDEYVVPTIVTRGDMG
ncbi:MAG: hypothetical protein J4F39_12620, partial [Candidatus Latescibacteria bacterium]|nr:hypothetical protein [Candidatus Latescibacterota bacterium]